jgi:hypothetical protein
MAEIDYVQILLGFLGGSGLVGVVVTYIQLREERKERARDRLIGLVMTSEMGRFLGSLGNHSNRLYDGLELARKLPEPSALWKPEDYRTLAELGRWQKEMSQVRRTLITRFHTISDNGDFLLTPTQWRSKTVECFDCWGRFSECMRDMLTLHLPEKKRKTEKRGAQTLPTDEDLHDALRKAETALDEAESAAQALDFEVRKSLGLTILEE